MSQIETASPSQEAGQTVEAPQVETPAAPEAPVTPNDAPKEAAPAPEAEWTPNLKFKAAGEEYEFEDWAKPLLKKDNYDNFVKLYEKAYGLDSVKTRHEKLKEEYGTVKGEYDQVKQGLAELGKLYQTGDLDAFFKNLQVPDEQIFKYVLDKINYQQMAPEQRQAKDHELNVMRQNRMLEAQYQQSQQVLNQYAVQARTMELENALSTPDTRAVADAFDAKIGRPGAFRDEVIKRGQHAAFVTQQDIPVQQAINEVMGLVKPFLGTPAQAQQQQAPAQQPLVKPPVIPNIGSGRSAGAVQKQFTSIADIENEYQNKFGVK